MVGGTEKMRKKRSTKHKTHKKSDDPVFRAFSFRESHMMGLKSADISTSGTFVLWFSCLKF